MSRGPEPGRKTKSDFVAIARDAWGDELPDWIAELARYASQTSGALAAKKIGYSQAVISHVIRASYAGDMRRVEDKVRGALMGVTVMCPVLGEIGRDRCLDEQKKPRMASSSIRSKLWRNCRGVGAPLCPNSNHQQKEPGE
jgi:hypothetical protein